MLEKTVFIFLLLALVIAEIESLNCVQCSQCPDPYNNATATLCASGTDTCFKSALRYPGGSIITKTCVASSQCTESSFGLLGIGYWITCCRSDGCNHSTSIYKMTNNQYFVISAILFVKTFLQYLL